MTDSPSTPDNERTKTDQIEASQIEASKVVAGAGAPEPGTDSPVVDWFGQSAADDAELADKLVDAVGMDEAERQFDRQATGEETQRNRHGDTIDPHQGEAAYQQADATPSNGSGTTAGDLRDAAAGAMSKIKERVTAAKSAVVTEDGSRGAASALPTDVQSDAEKLFHLYLRDHLAADSAGLALARRALHNNAGTEFEQDLSEFTAEIEADSKTLRHAMAELGVDPSPVKMLAARGSELAARLKTNGRLIQYSPSSRVLELEGLAAGVATKQQFWKSFEVSGQTAIDRAGLERLTARAAQQLDQVADLHRRAASIAFAA